MKKKPTPWADDPGIPTDIQERVDSIPGVRTITCTSGMITLTGLAAACEWVETFGKKVSFVAGKKMLTGRMGFAAMLRRSGGRPDKDLLLSGSSWIRWKMAPTGYIVSTRAGTRMIKRDVPILRCDDIKSDTVLVISGKTFVFNPEKVAWDKAFRVNVMKEAKGAKAAAAGQAV